MGDYQAAGSAYLVAGALVRACGGQAGGVTAPTAATLVALAWIQSEAPTPAENNPLNVGPHKKFATIDAGISATVATMGNGNYAHAGLVEGLRSVTDDGSAHAFCDRLQSAGWCGGPNAPCPGYGASIRRIYDGYRADPTKWQRDGGRIITSGSSPSGDAGAATPGVTKGGFDPLDPLNIQGNVIDPATAVINALGAIAAFLGNPANWRRAGMIVLGAGLAFAGVSLVDRDLASGIVAALPGPLKTAAHGATHAAEAAAAVAAV